MGKLIFMLTVTLIIATFSVKGQQAISDISTDNVSLQLDNSLSLSSLSSFRSPVTFSDQIEILQVVKIEEMVYSCHCIFILDCTASDGTIVTTFLDKEIGASCNTDLGCQIKCADLAFKLNQQSTRCDFTCPFGCGQCY